MAVSRRTLLATAAAVLATRAGAETVHGALPWHPYAGDPPKPPGPGQWHYFTPDEGAAVEALVDRLIPPEPEWPGGKDAGCATYIDRQLAGPYGTSAGLYMRPPFREGAKNFGPQSPLTPAQRYRAGLADLDAVCRQNAGGKPFAALAAAAQDDLLHRLESGAVTFPHTSAVGFFEQLLKDTQQGFLADPVYGGNRNMVAWRMIGFPGARYDYRDWIDRHNEPFPLPPVGIQGRPDWNVPA